RLRSPAGGENPAAALTAQGAMIGTADYMAPEQARDARSVDIRADVYSLGCTLYHLLTGGPPFAGGSAMQKIFNHLNKEPMPANMIRAEIPPEVAGMISKMMAKKPEDRYREPKGVAEVLAVFCPKTEATPRS